MIHRFILGNQVISTESQKRKILLGTYLVLMYLGVDFFFFIINLFNPQGEPTSLFLGFFVSLICLGLLRYQWTNTAIFLHLVRCNVLAFYFSFIDADPLQTGTYIFFIPSSLGAMAVFGYKERWVGIGFTILSYVLFLIAIFKPSQFSPSEAHFYLIIDFLIALLIGILIIIFFDRLVLQSETEILNKNSELTKINAELDRFVYSVSHDLRAPLSSISGLIQLAERSSDLKETEQYLNLMKGRIVRLEQFIRDIINFSRNVRSEVRLEPVALRELARETFDALKFISGADAMSIQNELPESLVLITDKTRLQIVLFNLISNSIQYRDQYKDPCYIRFSSTESGDRLILQIDDNGIGIDQAHHGSVFNMFYRASENSKGSGLGLYIVKEAMEKLGGVIALQSVLGEGTRFTLELPIQRS